MLLNKSSPGLDVIESVPDRFKTDPHFAPKRFWTDEYTPSPDGVPVLVISACDASASVEKFNPDGVFKLPTTEKKLSERLRESMPKYTKKYGLFLEGVSLLPDVDVDENGILKTSIKTATIPAFLTNSEADELARGREVVETFLQKAFTLWGLNYQVAMNLGHVIESYIGLIAIYDKICPENVKTKLVEYHISLCIFSYALANFSRNVEPQTKNIFLDKMVEIYNRKFNSVDRLKNLNSAAVLSAIGETLKVLKKQEETYIGVGEKAFPSEVFEQFSLKLQNYSEKLSELTNSVYTKMRRGATRKVAVAYIILFFVRALLIIQKRHGKSIAVLNSSQISEVKTLATSVASIGTLDPLDSQKIENLMQVAIGMIKVFSRSLNIPSGKEFWKKKEDLLNVFKNFVSENEKWAEILQNLLEDVDTRKKGFLGRLFNRPSEKIRKIFGQKLPTGGENFSEEALIISMSTIDESLKERAIETAKAKILAFVGSTQKRKEALVAVDPNAYKDYAELQVLDFYDINRKEFADALFALSVLVGEKVPLFEPLFEKLKKTNKNLERARFHGVLHEWLSINSLKERKQTLSSSLCNEGAQFLVAINKIGQQGEELYDVGPDIAFKEGRNAMREALGLEDLE